MSLPSPEELAERREAMFSFMLGHMETRCNECGVKVLNEDAHFGFHLKIDNIDQRVAHHSHPHEHYGPGEGP